jgi:hypothetical protein
LILRRECGAVYPLGVVVNWSGDAGSGARGGRATNAYLRSVVFGAASFLGLCSVPIAAKWILIGRWKPQQIRIWTRFP